MRGTEVALHSKNKLLSPFGAGVYRRAVCGPDADHKSLLLNENLMSLIADSHMKIIISNGRITHSYEN